MTMNGSFKARTRDSYVKEFLYVVFKRKWFIAGVVLVVLGGVAAGAMMSTRTFEASATLLMKRERGELLVTPTQSSPGNVSLRVNLDQDLNSEVELLQRRSLLGEVVRTLGAPAVLAGRLPGEENNGAAPQPPSAVKSMAQDVVGFVRPALAAPARMAGWFSSEPAIPEIDRAIASLDTKLRVAPVLNSNLIKVSFVSQDPRLASAVLETLIKGYLDQYSRIRSSPGTADFFRSQVREIGAQLKAAEDELREFDMREGITLLARQRELYLATAMEQETALQHARSTVDELKEKTQVLRTHLATLPEKIQTSEEMRKNPVTDIMAARLLELELERNKLLQKYTDQDRRVSDVEAQIEALREKFLAAEKWEFARKSFGDNPARNPFILELVNAEAERIRAEVRAKNLARTTSDYYARLRHADAMVIERARQERRIKTLEDSYLLYTKKSEEARISGALDENRIVNVALAEPVVVSTQAAGGRSTGQLFVLGAIVGLVGGIGGAFCREYLSQTFTTEASVGRELDLPVVASIKDERK
jgi:uncharacterized protein involved in exopolysaccharide biosynthesis